MQQRTPPREKIVAQKRKLEKQIDAIEKRKESKYEKNAAINPLKSEIFQLNKLLKKMPL